MFEDIYKNITTNISINSVRLEGGSVNNYDYEPSKKYPITLKEARNRALKALERARKRDRLYLEELFKEN